MDISIALGSVVIIAIVAVIVRRVTELQICPICVGVSTTWLWMLIAREFGWMVDPSVLALLLGGSVVGVAYRLSSRVPPQRDWWLKVGFIPVGLLGAYGILERLWPLAGATFLVALAIVVAARWRRDTMKASSALIAEAEEKLERCCD